ncbi:trihelix protein [Artemisia annua]|uniref:Trihelix protein n=1 Tax=Artemisia annua TaxID=35608 RepID=A0A2U1P5W1_ARTAN|nr:trihelix protein [Artemisia annua]
MANNVNATGSDQNNVSPISVAAPAVMAVPPPPVMNHKRTFPFSQPNMSGSTNSASSSDTDDEPPRKKKKWEDFFGKLMKEVIQKQEELQMRFLDTLERREKDRVAREEAWRAQEIVKMNQEYEMLVKERSVVAAKDAAIITFLQKLTEKNSDGLKLINNEAKAKLTGKNLGSGGSGSAGENMLSPSPSRWPKAEIKALITLRTQLDLKYQENVPKGPLWEEISALMRNIGYNRNAKRCKEKWENINKYYKKLKESNKKRSENSKTCSYFDQLDAIYREKSNAIIVAQPENQWPPATVVQENTPAVQQPVSTTDTAGFGAKPEQQWRLPTVVKETPQVDDQGSDNESKALERGEMGQMMFGSCVNGPGCVFVVKIELRTYGGVLV